MCYTITLIFSFIVCHVTILQSKLLQKIDTYVIGSLHYTAPFGSL